MKACFPECNKNNIDQASEDEMNVVMDVTRAIRNLRAGLKVPPSKPANVVISAEGEKKTWIERNVDGIKFLTRTNELGFAEELEKEKYVGAHEAGVDVYLEIAGLVDVEGELKKLEAEMAKIDGELARSQGKLSNEKFTSRAPVAIVEKERKIVTELLEKKQMLEERKAALAK